MILVTGATGNVGSEVVAQLIAAGCRVRGLTRDPLKAARWNDRAETAIGYFRDPESIARACAGVRSVLLIAAGADVAPLSKLLDATRLSGAPRIIFISGSVADWPNSEIGALFRDREGVVRNCGLPFTVLRPCDFMSNAYQWTNTIKRRGVVYNVLGSAKSALIAPEDVAAVAVKCLTTGEFDGQTLMLTGSEALSVPEQAEILSQTLRTPIRCIEVSVAQAVDSLIQSGMSEVAARYAGEIYERERRGEAEKLAQQFATITGKTPRTFREWAQEHMEKFGGKSLD
jgi:(4-alkanoyl-5-oxo-2,5-dihydrofuran-3-yl)methyl phosphate reductase